MASWQRTRCTVSSASQIQVLESWRRYLAPAGRLVLVEYDAAEGNRWVPYPVSFSRLAGLAQAAGYSAPEYLTEHPSRMLHRIYSALLRSPSRQTL
jgi:hypothetical protein